MHWLYHISQYSFLFNLLYNFCKQRIANKRLSPTSFIIVNIFGSFIKIWHLTSSLIGGKGLIANFSKNFSCESLMVFVFLVFKKRMTDHNLQAVPYTVFFKLFKCLIYNWCNTQLPKNNSLVWLSIIEVHCKREITIAGVSR